MTYEELVTRLTTLEREVALLRHQMEKNEGREISPMGKINDAADAEGASVAFGPYGRRTLFATATRYESVACDEGRFIFPEECASALLGLSAPRSATCSLKPLPVASTCGSEGKRLEAQSSSSLTLTLRKLMECKGPDGRYLVTRKVHWQALLGITPRNVRKIAES